MSGSSAIDILKRYYPSCMDADSRLLSAMRAAVAEEREACAKTAEECQQGHQPLTPSGFVAKIAAAIRKRGQQ